jgi:hypothetical protein
MIKKSRVNIGIQTTIFLKKVLWLDAMTSTFRLISNIVTAMVSIRTFNIT